MLAATEAIAPALELIDSRIADWKIKLPDTIADNASSAGFALGEEPRRPADVDLNDPGRAVPQRRAGRATGRSDAVLGDPLTAVAWLARTVAKFGVRLRAGHIVLPGSCTRAVDLRPGDTFRAEFGARLRRSLQFKEETRMTKATAAIVGRATSAPTCCTSCSAPTSSSRAG